MFDKPSVFIIGAGASAEYGLPTAENLKSILKADLEFRFDAGRKIQGSDTMLAAMRARFGGDINTYIRLVRELTQVLDIFPSIDEALHYLAGKPEVVAVGKMAIANAILEGERRSSIKKASNGVWELGDADCWLDPFLSMAVSGGRREEAAEFFKKVTVINFNYDRVVEQYLYQALQRRAALSATEAQQILSGVKVIRPYGSIGFLPWQQQADSLEYGGSGGHDNLVAISERIKTYTEQSAHLTVPSEIKAAIGQASLISFLGFGFHQQNMRLLSAPTSSNADIFATAFNVPTPNHSVLERQISEIFSRDDSGSLSIVNLKAGVMLRDLRPTMMAASLN